MISMGLYDQPTPQDNYKNDVRNMWKEYTIISMQYERNELMGIIDYQQAVDVATYLCMLWNVMYAHVKGSSEDNTEEKEFLSYEKYVDDKIKLIYEIMIEVATKDKTVRAGMERAIRQALYRNKITQIG